MDHLDKAYAETFTTGWGDQVLTDLQDTFHVYSPMFSIDPYALAFREGQRSVVLEIMGAIERGIDGASELPTHSIEGDQLDG